MTTKSEYARLCATKKSREALAKQVTELAERCGAKVVERRERPEYREIGLDLGFGPYRVMMKFSGTSSVGAFLGHWYINLDSDAVYSEAFESAIGYASVNPYHRRKTTTCTETFEAFLGSIERGLQSLAIEMVPDTTETAPASGKPQFYDCGVCGAMHPATWDGDCRQDNARFNPEQLDERYGSDGWEEVDMGDVPSDPTTARFLPNRPLGRK